MYTKYFNTLKNISLCKADEVKLLPRLEKLTWVTIYKIKGICGLENIFKKQVAFLLQKNI